MRIQNFLGSWLIALSILAIGSTGLLFAAAADSPKADDTSGYPLDVINIQNKGYKQDRQGQVRFTHRKHAQDYKIACWDCHHEFKDGKNAWAPWGETKKCSQCHDPAKDNDKAMNLAKAFHVNCKDCHQALYLKKKKTGPHKKCSGCHERKS